MLDYQGDYPAYTTIINGWVDDRGQPTSTSLNEAISQAASVCENQRQAFKNARENSGFANGFGPSPLSKVYTPETVADEAVQDAAYLVTKQQDTEAVLAHYVNRLRTSVLDDTDSDSESEYFEDEDVCRSLSGLVGSVKEQKEDENDLEASIAFYDDEKFDSPTDTAGGPVCAEDRDASWKASVEMHAPGYASIEANIEHDNVLCRDLKVFEVYLSDSTPIHSGQTSGYTSDAEEDHTWSLPSNAVDPDLEKCDDPRKCTIDG